MTENIQIIAFHIGNALIGLSVIFVMVGLFGVFRFENFYAKVLSSSKIDTVAMITLVIGVVLRNGFTWFSAKALLVMLFVMFINPIITSRVVLSAREESASFSSSLGSSAASSAEQQDENKGCREEVQDHELLVRRQSK